MFTVRTLQCVNDILQTNAHMLLYSFCILFYTFCAIGFAGKDRKPFVLHFT